MKNSPERSYNQVEVVGGLVGTQSKPGLQQGEKKKVRRVSMAPPARPSTTAPRQSRSKAEYILCKTYDTPFRMRHMHA